MNRVAKIGMTGKTAVFPQFCKIKKWHWQRHWQKKPSWFFGLACLKFTVAALMKICN